jgi:PAS domain S-box-containing protein
VENQLSRVCDALPGLVWTALPDGQIDYLNQQWRDYTGLSSEQVSGVGWRSGIHPDDLAPVLERWQVIFDSGQPGELEARLRRHDGEYRRFHVRTCRLTDENGTFIKWCGINIDIEDRKRAEEALEESERRFKAILDGLPTVVTLMTAEGEVQHANRHMLEYLGVASMAEMKRRIVGQAFHPDDRPEVMRRWQYSVHTGEPYDHHARLRRADGVYRWFHTRGFPLRDAAGRIALWYLLQTDVEERRQAEGLLAGEKLLLEMVALGQSLPSIFDALCRVLDEAAEGCSSCVLLLDRAGATVQSVIAPGLATGYVGALEGRTISTGAGPCGMAAIMKTQVIVSDVKADDRWGCEGWTNLALAHGLGACWSTPIFSLGGDSLGTFAIYRRDSGSPTPFHQSLIQKLVHVASIAIERTRGEEDRKLAEDLLAGEKRLLELVAGGGSRAAILEGLCRLVENTAGGCYCSVVLADHSGARVEYGAAPSLPQTFIDSIIGRPINTETGPCGMAAFLNQQIISTDLSAEVRWPTWCPMAMAHGLKSCWSTPISATNGKVLGAFALYHESAQTPTSLLQSMIKQFTHIASIAIERTQSDAALKRSEAFLAKAQQLSSTGSFSWRVQPEELSWSAQLYRIFEFDAFEAITLERILTRTHPDDAAALREMLDRACADGADFECEHRLLMPDLSVKYLHMVASGVRDAHGQFVYIGAVQDVTQRRLFENALVKARLELAHVARISSLGALAASFAHEVNQPLSGIVTNAGTCLRMLASEPPNVEGARETARRTIRDGKRASDVITRLRAMFSNKHTQAESVDLNLATQEVISLLQSELQRGGVIVRPEFAVDLSLVVGDRVQLQQVILNLLSNAAAAMSSVEDRPRHLTVRTQVETDRSVRLSVQDVGVGIEPENVERLFEAFYTTKQGGMGIGLSVSRSIIERHQGRLWMEPNDGPGATFAFSIPCQPDPALTAPSPS